MNSYHPSNTIPAAGILFLLALLVFGAGLGVLTFFVSKLVYLVILFPILLGFACGFIAQTAVKIGKVRSPIVAAVFTVLMVLIMYGTVRMCEYLDFKQQLRTMIVEEYGETDQALIDEFENAVLEDETGQTGLLGFVAYEAKEGESFTRLSDTDGSSGISISGVGAYIYWFIEILIIAGIALSMVIKQARTPFCETCDRWYGGDYYFGALPMSEKETVKAAFESGVFSPITKQLHKSANLPAIGFYLNICPQCQTSDAVFTAKLLSVGSKGKINESKFKEAVIPMNTARELERAVVNNDAVSVRGGPITQTPA